MNDVNTPASLEPSIPLEAVVFFNGGEWWLRTGDGGQWPLHAAPLDESRAFVFYDESHTRGADFRLHPRARAMLTIGKRMLKDTLMQAAGRMRQLARDGSQQRLLLAGGEDVAETILTRNNCEHITPALVLTFAMQNTVEALQVALPAWTGQGQK